MKVRDVKVGKTHVLTNMKDPALNGLAGKVRSSRYRITGTNSRAVRVFTIRLDVGGLEHDVPATNLEPYDPMTFFTESERDVYVKAMAQMHAISIYLMKVSSTASPAVLAKNQEGASAIWTVANSKTGTLFDVVLEVRRSTNDGIFQITTQIEVGGILTFGEESIEVDLYNTDVKEVRKYIRAQLKPLRKKLLIVLDELNAVEAA